MRQIAGPLAAEGDLGRRWLRVADRSRTRPRADEDINSGAMARAREGSRRYAPLRGEGQVHS